LNWDDYKPTDLAEAQRKLTIDNNIRAEKERILAENPPPEKINWDKLMDELNVQ
jgi:hypothetical protein